MRTYVILFLLGFFLSGCATVDVCVDKDGKPMECPNKERPIREFGGPHGRY